ncbi:MarR family winged helix-turn-helix transcriptional regulator [Croceibacterium mercuriale]|uniref:MarR family winged helix-turn-helix transcriptional regulator n=1 Tax=Croceibacterium mercuriale TaxID=1572751 RepID=UPI00068A4456|nr:MarR family transcriptional regulator [Croceibacterium mercuriale]
MDQMTALRRGEMNWGVLARSIGPRVRLLRNVLAARTEAAGGADDLPTGALTVLALVSANPGTSQTLLARRAGINKSALVGIVDQLEQRALVARDRSAVDRRRNSLSITRAGEAALHDLHAAALPAEAPIRAALNPGEQALLVSLLDRALASMEGQAAQGQELGRAA